MAFVDAFDMTFTIKYDIEAMTGQVMLLVMLKDSLSLFDILTKVSVTTEKRPMIDLKAVKDSYNRIELQDVAYARSVHNIADALTKIKKNSTLIEVIRKALLDHPIEQWIIRETKSDSVLKKGGMSLN